MEDPSPAKDHSPMKLAFISPAKPTISKPIYSKVDVSQVRAALHKGTPKALVCREKEMGELSTWLDEHMVAAKPGSMYVSGPPGTGKTATLEFPYGWQSGQIQVNCHQLCGALH